MSLFGDKYGTEYRLVGGFAFDNVFVVNTLFVHRDLVAFKALIGVIHFKHFNI